MGATRSLAQTVQYVLVHKDIDYLQTNATTAIVYAAETNGGGGPYGFGADVVGSNLGGITAPGLTLPAGSTFNNPGQFSGHLAYNAADPEWTFGAISTNDWGVSSQMQNDSLFPNGTYQFVVQGTTIPLGLTGSTYPNAPIATLTGGAWSNGQYFIEPSNALAITTSIFTGYGANVDGYISIRYGSGSVSVFHSSAPQSNSLTYTVPANTLAVGQTNTMSIVFFAIVNTNADLAGSRDIAYYKADTTFQVVAQAPSPPSVQVVQVYKNIAYVQTNATTAIVDPTPVGPDYGGPYGFQSDVIGTNLSGITPPGLVLPSGSTYNDPSTFNGQLTYAGVEVSFAGLASEWSFGPNDWGGTSQVEMDSAFANGTYKFTVQGTNISLNLSGNVYPNIPIATLTGGAWSNGKYVINASNALSITTSTFTGYGENVDGRIFIFASIPPIVAYHSSAPASNSLRYTVPANTLASGQTTTMFIGFDAIVSTNATLAGSYNVAYYEIVTKFNVVALPQVSIQSASGGMVQISFGGTLQQSSDLETWSDVFPQPASPWLVTLGGGNQFFRAVNSN